MLRKSASLLVLMVALVGVALMLSQLTGCAAVGYMASAIPKSRDAQYKNLAGKKVAVLVWAHRGLRIDYPNLQLDLGNTVQAQLLAKTDEDSLKLTQFPWEVRSMLRFVRERPELEGQSVAQWAPRVSDIDRLIFIELMDFSTRSGTAVQLLRGGITVNVKVIEIENGVGKLAYESPNMKLFFPEDAPEGVVDVSEAAIYSGTVRAMGTEIARLFYPHVIEE